MLKYTLHPPVETELIGPGNQWEEILVQTAVQLQVANKHPTGAYQAEGGVAGKMQWTYKFSAFNSLVTSRVPMSVSRVQVAP